MEWKELKEKVYYLDGSLRDIYIHNTTKEDWKIWADFVNEHYRISHHFFETDTNENKIVINKVAGYWKGITEFWSTAHVYLDDIQINIHFFDENEIENDLKPSEFNSHEDHQKLINYLSGLSKALNKIVQVTAENQREIILMSVDGDIIDIPL